MDEEGHPTISKIKEEICSQLNTDDEMEVSSHKETDDEAEPTIEDMEKERTMRYISGEITFEQYTEFLEDNYQDIEMPQDNIHVLSVSTSEKAVKKQTGGSKRRRTLLDPTLQGLMGEANVKFARGEYDEAIRMCMEVIRQCPNSRESFQTLGMIFEEMGQPRKALQYSLIAAYLSPTDKNEWLRLVDLSLEQNDIAHALTCYEKAIRADSSDFNTYNQFYPLLLECKKVKRATEIMNIMLTMLEGGKVLLNEESCSEYFVGITRELTEIFSKEGMFSDALKTIKKLFRLYSNLISAEDVNSIIELNILMNEFISALKVVINYCGVILTLQRNLNIDQSNVNELNIATYSMIDSIYIPEEIPIDIKSKIVTILIHMDLYDASKIILIEMLNANSIEQIGDLILDIAEAYMIKKQQSSACPLLEKLVVSDSYNLAAVWLKYGEALISIEDIDRAVDAYERVLHLAPSHKDARITLSKLQHQIGRHLDAIDTLDNEEVPTNDQTYKFPDFQLMLPKCILLKYKGLINEYTQCCKSILFGHFTKLLRKKMLTHSAQDLNIYYLKCRMRFIRRMFGGLSSYTKMQKQRNVLLRASNIDHSDLWILLLELIDTLIAHGRHQDLKDVINNASFIEEFVTDEDKLKELIAIFLCICVITRDGKMGYEIIHEFCIENMNNNRIFNIYTQMMMFSGTHLHNRFNLRLMIKNPENKVLGLINGHFCMISGSYKQALGEYITLIKNEPNNNLIFLCMGCCYVHLASQKYCLHRHLIVSQGFASMFEYMKYRGACQESYYNVGRAYHHLGINHIALHYYNKALDSPVACQEEKFDLKMEIAYNIIKIYEKSQSYDLAEICRNKYLII